MNDYLTGREPILGDLAIGSVTGAEPMLGAWRRPGIDRDLFWGLLQIDKPTRDEAIERVLAVGSACFYARMVSAVLSPEARYFRTGMLWKVQYTYYHKLAAMDTLVRLDGSRALGGLIRALNHDDLALQQAAIACIARLDSEDAERVLLVALEDARMPIRHAALQALADRWTLPMLRRLATPVAALVMEAAAWLADHDSGRVLPALAASLRDTRPGQVNREIAQQALLRAVGRLGARQGGETAQAAVKVLRTALDQGWLTGSTVRAVFDALSIIDTEEVRAAAIVYSLSYHSA